ncbi:hypothetical protein H7200_00960 [Candidatus Saccharibacteria bacterium]|nr:hypothetical protein [Candidatus Saccharibacteria bacterium]
MKKANKTENRTSQKPFLLRHLVPILVTIFLIVAAAVAAYIFIVAPLLKTSHSDSTPVTAEKTYKDNFVKQQTAVESLLRAGDAASIAKAEAITTTQIAEADKSGNNDFVVEATLAKATVLIETGRAQQALDDILFPMLKTYSNDQNFTEQIYGVMSFAYRQLDNQVKADEYFNKIQPKGWD